MNIRINFTRGQAAALTAAVTAGIDGQQTSPAFDRALSKLERTDRPTFTTDEVDALHAEVLNAIDDYPVISPALNAAIDKLEATR